MAEIRASAPGKLVLLGDYAVLEGAPGLAVAVDRRARVRLVPRSDARVTVDSAELRVRHAAARVDAVGRLHWDDAAAERMRLVDAVWNGLAQAGQVPAGGADLELDTAGFFVPGRGRPQKLGLGSSAALSVALAGALGAASATGAVPAAAALCEDPAWLDRLLALHGGWQGGRGSGIDLAASLHGGLILFRRRGDHAGVETQPWPPAGAHCLFAWSGQSVSTAGYLERLAAWREAQPRAHAACMGELVELAEEVPAVLAGDAAGFVGLVQRYAQALARLAAASGLAIFTPAQHRLGELAAAAGGASKPCGAGGDFSLVVAPDAARLDVLQRSIIAAGLRPLALGMEPCGLQYES